MQKDSPNIKSDFWIPPLTFYNFILYNSAVEKQAL